MHWLRMWSVITVALLLAACGGALPPATISVWVDRDGFSPDRVEVATGKPVSIVVRNIDAQEHQWESVAEFKAGFGSRFRAAFLLAAEPGVSGVVASANRRSAV
jgi:hypothetical protein